MKQTTENKIVSRSVDLLLKKDSSFREEDTVKLIEGISEHQVYKLNGNVVNQKELSFDELIKTKVSGVSGWHRFDKAFERHFTDTKFDGDVNIKQTLDKAYEYGQNGLDEANIFGEIRSISVGDVLAVTEWGEDGHAVGSPRFFLVSGVGFDEFLRADGAWI